MSYISYFVNIRRKQKTIQLSLDFARDFQRVAILIPIQLCSGRFLNSVIL